MSDCVFCHLNEPERQIGENEFVRAFWDANPAASGHAIIFPKRHVVSWFDLTPEEVQALHELSKVVRAQVEEQFRPDAYTIGVNEGELAGRVIHHVHMHIIPRYRGDVPDPKGGVRNVLPRQGRWGM